MSDCPTNHARLVRLEGELHKSGKDYICRGELTFKRFSEINRQRCESSTGFNHKLSSWSTSDWFLALLGELGEAANIAKKLNRVRDGIPGNKVSAEELRIKLRQELGDAFVYLDLLCQSLGVAIGDAATEVFNSKSEEIGCLITIGEQGCGDVLEVEVKPAEIGVVYGEREQ